MDDLQQTAPPPADRHGSMSPWREPPIHRFLGLAWRHRGLLVAGSLLPAVLVAVLLLALPRRHTATLAYERPVAESEYSILARRFYSQENLDRIIAQLRQHGLTEFAGRLEKARTERSVEKLIGIEPVPRYPERLRTTDPETSQRISELLAQLLFLRVAGEAREETIDAAIIVRENFEEVLPVYEVRKRLRDSAQELTTLAAAIEDSRFLLQLQLQEEQARLEKLKGIDGGASQEVQGIVLEFSDVQNSREFLPLSYQIQAAESRIIDLQEQLNADAERLDYYLRVLALVNVLLDNVESHLLTRYTAPEYLAFLAEQLSA